MLFWYKSLIHLLQAVLYNEYNTNLLHTLYIINARNAMYKVVLGCGIIGKSYNILGLQLYNYIYFEKTHKDSQN